LVSDNSAHYVEQRLIAEIEELCPAAAPKCRLGCGTDGGRGARARREARSPCRHSERAEPAQSVRLRQAVVPARAARCYLFRGLPQGWKGSGPGFPENRAQQRSTALLGLRAV